MVPVEPPGLAASVREASAEWKELAYAVLPSAASRQFYRGHPTFGPRWTSLMDPARVPVLLVRDYGQGAIVLAQLGAAAVAPKPDMAVDRVEEAPAYLRVLSRNLIDWAAGGRVP
jgi:hypothetical protein